MSTNLVFFDFDGTLTTWDSFELFLVFLFKKHPLKIVKVPALVYYCVLLKLGFINNHTFKERVLGLLMKGMKKKTIASVVKSFIEIGVPKILDWKTVRDLKNHVKAGDKVYIVSASFDFYLKPIFSDWSVQGIICTNVEWEDTRLTGDIRGQTCYGMEKLKRLMQIFPMDELRNAYVYTDDLSDFPMLETVKHKKLVKRTRNRCLLSFLKHLLLDNFSA